MAKLDKYLNETEILLSTLRIDYKSIGIEMHNSISDLKREKEGFYHFEKAIQYDLFRDAFGWKMARFDEYLFMVKKGRNNIVYIEVLL